MGTLLGFAPFFVFIAAVRLRVDAGLVLVVLVSMLVRRPFTLQYAREQIPAELWDNPAFVKTNYLITCAWAVAFIVMVAADLALTYFPELPRPISIVATIGSDRRRRQVH